MSRSALLRLAAVALGAALIAGGLWRSRIPSAEAPSADPAQSLAPSRPHVDAAAASPAPAAHPLLAEAETLAMRWLDDPSTTDAPRRVRLAHLATEDRTVRIIEVVDLDPILGPRARPGAIVMRADAVLVAVPAGADGPALVARLHEAGFATEPAHPLDAAITVLVPALTLDAVPEMLAALAAALPDIPAEPDYIRFASRVTSDDYDIARLWGMEKIEAPAAWTLGTGATSVVVAVVDSGVHTTHPDLAANMWINPGEIAGNSQDDDGNGYIDDLHGWNSAGPNASVTDTDGHGTHVAGTIGARGNNGAGVVGVNWTARIMAVRAGNRTFADSALVNALRYIITNRQRGVPVVAINMSLGGSGFGATFRQEVVNARDAGILVIAAAGNERSDNDTIAVYPAGYDVDNIIAVASTHQGDGLSVFSNRGATSVHLAAPGTAILSTYNGGGYSRLDGTSMAAPHVAGAAALIATIDPSLTAAQIRTRILETVDPVPALAGRVATGGRLNLRRAVSPALLRPRVALTIDGVPARAAALDRAGLALPLGATLLPDGGVVPVAALAWSQVEGPAAIVFSAPGSAATSAVFPDAGRYRLRLTATAGPLQEQEELVVAVGGDIGATDNRLRGWWRFDDTGPTTLDASADGRHGTVTAASRTSLAALGTAMEFNGSTSRVAFTAPGSGALTIAGWARASAANPNTIFPRVLHMREGLLFGGFDTAQVDDGNINTLKFTLDNGISDLVWHTPPGTFFTGSWYHVAVSFDAAAAQPAPVFYINGVRQLTGTQTSVATPASVPAGAGYIGDRGDGGRPWLGQLDELRLYDRVLGEPEVAWISREVTLTALAGGTLARGVAEDPFAVPLTFTMGATGLPAPQLAKITWSAASGGASFLPADATSTTATFASPGTHLVRFDATSADGVHVSRTLAVDVVSTPVDREGWYTGTTAAGGAWTLRVRGDGSAVFLGAGGRGSFQRDFIVPAWGVFSLTDRSGSPVTGRIHADGTVSGTIDGVDFSGARSGAGFGDPDPTRDGLYSGWLVDTGVRAAALVERGRVAIAVEEPGAQRAAGGAIASGGGFTLIPAPGATFAGIATGGRIDGVVTVPGMPERGFVLLREGVSPVRRLTNISVRGVAGSGDAVLIPGFVIEGEGSLPVLIRGIGPGLAEFGVAGALAAPRLILRQGSMVVQENTGWTLGGNDEAIVAANALTGAFALDPALADSALTLPLAALPHTVQVEGADGGTGVALAEIYDARTGAHAGEVINLSGRGFVGTDDQVLIGGFAITGEAPALVLVRAAGPALVPFGVADALARPRLVVQRGQNVLAAGGPWGAGDTPGTIAEAASRVGAFAFDPDSDDAALLLFLPPGPYTAQVSGDGATTGIALIEIYRVPGM